MKPQPKPKRRKRGYGLSAEYARLCIAELIHLEPKGNVCGLLELCRIARDRIAKETK